MGQPRRATCFFVTLAAYLLIAVALSSPALKPAPPITLSARPLVGLAPVTWTIRVIVVPHEDNRFLVVSYWKCWQQSCRDAEFIASSGMNLDGEYERRTPYRATRTEGRPGLYVILAELKNGHGEIRPDGVSEVRARVMPW